MCWLQRLANKALFSSRLKLLRWAHFLAAQGRQDHSGHSDDGPSRRQAVLGAHRLQPDVRSIRWRLAVGLLWPVLVAVLSVPSVLAILSLSIPPENNVLGISEPVLTLSQGSIGAVLFALKAWIVPSLARKAAAKWYTGPNTVAEQQARGALLIPAQLAIIVVAPAVTVLLANQACFAGWCVFPCVNEWLQLICCVTP